jgi:hypothetical protein
MQDKKATDKIGTGLPIAAKFKISDGREVVVHVGKGKHSFKAQRIADGKQDLFTKALMSMLVTFDGNPVVMEEFDNLLLPDFNLIQEKFTEANFTVTQPGS